MRSSHPTSSPDQKIASSTKWNLVILALVVAGLFLRLLAGWRRPGLWYDEILWFDHFIDGLSFDSLAPAYTLFHQHYFLSLTGLEEYKIRAVSILAGLAVVPLFALLTTRIFEDRKLTVIGTLLISTNIMAISFAHELKPYSLELFLHTLWLLTLLGCSSGRASVWWSSLILVGGSTLSYELAPLIPFQVVYMIFLLWRRRIKTVDLLSCFGMIAALFLFLPDTLSGAKGLHQTLWGKRYGVFYEPEIHGSGAIAYATWLLSKISSYVSYSLNWFRDLPFSERSTGFRSGYGYIESAWIGALLCCATFLRVTQTRLDDRRMIPVYILAGYTIAGVLHLHPLGFFRGNLFIFPYATLTVLFVVEGLLERLPTKTKNVTLGAIMAPTLFFTIVNPIGIKSFYNLNWFKVVTTICEEAKSQHATLFMDAKTAFALNFYLKISAPPECSTRITRHVFTSPETLARLLQRHSDAYVFFEGGPTLPPDEIHSLIVDRYHGTRLANAGGMYEYRSREP